MRHAISGRWASQRTSKTMRRSNPDDTQTSRPRWTPPLGERRLPLTPAPENPGSSRTLGHPLSHSLETGGCKVCSWAAPQATGNPPGLSTPLIPPHHRGTSRRRPANLRSPAMPHRLRSDHVDQKMISMAPVVSAWSTDTDVSPQPPGAPPPTRLDPVLPREHGAAPLPQGLTGVPPPPAHHGPAPPRHARVPFRGNA